MSLSWSPWFALDEQDDDDEKEVRSKFWRCLIDEKHDKSILYDGRPVYELGPTAPPDNLTSQASHPIQPCLKTQTSWKDIPKNKGYLDPEAYTIGWICALPLEMAAATKALDEEYTLPRRGFLLHEPDANLYTTGRIAGHNVVLAWLPAGRTGTGSAAIVAARMRDRFSNLRICLLVGVGGGVPSKEHDVRLGDVVVSQPTAQHGGVVQYDFGKQHTEGKYDRTGALNAPPTVLLSAVSKFQAYQYLDQARLRDFWPKVQNIPLFAKPGLDDDLLFKPKCFHKAGLNCDICDRRGLVKRKPRPQYCCSLHGITFDRDQDLANHLAEPHAPQRFHLEEEESRLTLSSGTFLRNGELTKVQEAIQKGQQFQRTEPMVHYGTIASGNTVMKDGVVRDRISAELGGVLCFEMEATGLMNSFPCLVVRGVCDYADSHKNKQWQPYAAASAAACAKAILAMIPSDDVLQAERVVDATADEVRNLKIAERSKELARLNEIIKGNKFADPSEKTEGRKERAQIKVPSSKLDHSIN
ncbi:MAG: hypothetical protein M1820_007160 [Bogoriella megaspora]|nr:MAG: hypothetical protein M1820_007160 [Bogoriella megaspora]